jgi:hypothetical protein
LIPRLLCLILSPCFFFSGHHATFFLPPKLLSRGVRIALGDEFAMNFVLFRALFLANFGEFFFRDCPKRCTSNA